MQIKNPQLPPTASIFTSTSALSDIYMVRNCVYIRSYDSVAGGRVLRIESLTHVRAVEATDKQEVLVTCHRAHSDRVAVRQVRVQFQHVTGCA